MKREQLTQKRVRSLNLHKETLRLLEITELQDLAGAGQNTNGGSSCDILHLCFR
jgi:hypothetical protein